MLTSFQQLKKTGKVKAIGLSNFNLSRMANLITKTGILPKVDIVEAHPYLPQNELIDFCREKGIIVQAYSPLGSGRAPYLMEDETVSYSQFAYLLIAL
jgi:diketogulonate reductase-like aldo/keto reductase